MKFGTYLSLHAGVIIFGWNFVLFEGALYLAAYIRGRLIFRGLSGFYRMISKTI